MIEFAQERHQYSYDAAELIALAMGLACREVSRVHAMEQEHVHPADVPEWVVGSTVSMDRLAILMREWRGGEYNDEASDNGGVDDEKEMPTEVPSPSRQRKVIPQRRGKKELKGKGKEGMVMEQRVGKTNAGEIDVDMEEEDEIEEYGDVDEGPGHLKKSKVVPQRGGQKAEKGKERQGMVMEQRVGKRKAGEIDMEIGEP